MKFLKIRARTSARCLILPFLFLSFFSFFFHLSSHFFIRGILLNLIHGRKTYSQVYAVFQRARNPCPQRAVIIRPAGEGTRSWKGIRFCRRWSRFVAFIERRCGIAREECKMESTARRNRKLKFFRIAVYRVSMARLFICVKWLRGLHTKSTCSMIYDLAVLAKGNRTEDFAAWNLIIFVLFYSCTPKTV